MKVKDVVKEAVEIDRLVNTKIYMNDMPYYIKETEEEFDNLVNSNNQFIKLDLYCRNSTSSETYRYTKYIRTINKNTIVYYTSSFSKNMLHRSENK